MFRKKDPRATFVKAAEKTIRRLRDGGGIRYDGELFAFHLDGDRTVMLGNMFGRWQSLGGEEADQYLTTALSGLLAETDQPKTYADAADRLLPGVRDRAALESARWMAEMNGSSPPVDIPNRQLGSTIRSLLLLDSPTTMMTVNDQHLADWEVDFNSALDRAVANLQNSTGVARWGLVGDSVYASLWNDDYDASRLLVDAIIDPLELSGDPVAFVPHRNRLIVTGADDPEGLLTAMDLTEQELDQPSQISAVPIVRRHGLWSDLELPADHPASRRLNRLQAVDRSLACGATTPIIQAVMGEEIYVANSILAENGGVIVSSATWIAGGPSIIPEVDRVLFFRDQDTHWMVAWKDVVDHLADLMEPTDFYPKRFRVSGFPTTEQLAEMPQIRDWQS